MKVLDTNEPLFATGEIQSGQATKLSGLHSSTASYKNAVCLYNAEHTVTVDSQSADLAPIVAYHEHTDTITCLCSLPSTNGLFLSGSRDCTVKLYDRRHSKAVGMLGSKNAVPTAVDRAHNGMVTSIDAMDHLVATGAVDRTLRIWDIRTGAALPLDEYFLPEHVLKIAFGTSTSASAAHAHKCRSTQLHAYVQMYVTHVACVPPYCPTLAIFIEMEFGLDSSCCGNFKNKPSSSRAPCS